MALYTAKEGARLTDRERQVLDLLTLGLTNPQIGQRLGVKEGTARFHVDNAATKLGAVNRTHAAALWAVEMYKQHRKRVDARVARVIESSAAVA